MDQRVEVPGASAADWPGTSAAGRAIVSIRGVRKVYASGLEALGGVDLASGKARSSRFSDRTAPARPR